MSAVLDRVRALVRRHDLIRSDTRVVAAVSGGSDSVALVYALHDLDARNELRVVGLVHLNHQLRRSADDDERFCVRLADTLRLPILVERADVGARAQRERRSVEDAGRASRYECFERARAKFDADVVALGHTRDDQAETFLLRLVRGAGPRGLAGMHPRTGSIVRPLLGCRRHELRAWLAARGLPYVEDETNQDVGIPRNRVRAELLPFLESRFNPEIVEVLAGEADLARETWSWMQTAADELANVARVEPVDARLSGSGPRALAPGSDAVTFRIAPLLAAPPALARLVLWRAMNELAAGRPVGFEHTMAAFGLLTAERNAAIDLPGQRAQRIGPHLVLTGRSPGAVGRSSHEKGENSEDLANLFWYPLSIPGEVALPEAGCTVSAEPIEKGPYPFFELDAAEKGVRPLFSDRGAIVGNGRTAVVRGDLCRGSLAVRNRRPGDRFRPVGLKGRKKLQDYFVDRKIARGERDTVPIVVDGADRIVWVAGHGIDEAFRVTDPAQAVLILRLRQP